MINAELLVATLLTPKATAMGARVVPETDTESLGQMPLWQFNLLGDGQNGNGQGIYAITLDLSVFAVGIDAAIAQATAAYDAVWGWDSDPLTAVVDGVGWVQQVDDISFFSRMGTPEMTGALVRQYAGSFGLSLRSNS